MKQKGADAGLGTKLDHEAIGLQQTFKYEQITGWIFGVLHRKMCHNDKIAFIPSRHNSGNKSGYCFDKELSYIDFSSCFTLMRFTM